VTRDDVLMIVKKYLVEAVEELDPAQIEPSMSMKDLGANSLDIVEVVSCSMRELKVKVPRSELSKLTNIGDLVNLLYDVSLQKAATQPSMG
jgi:acyl carrier protein